MKLTYIDTTKRAHGHLSWEKLAKIAQMSVEEYQQAHRKHFGNVGIDCRPFIDGVKCPFGERDLMHDTCYIGGGEHKCPHFVRYEDRHIVCSHPTKRPIQLELFT